MAKKKIANRTERIKDDVPIILTDVVEKIGLLAKPDDMMIFTRVNKDSFMATITQPVTKEIKKEEYSIVNPTKLPPTSFVVDLYKYKREKKGQNKAIPRNMEVAVPKKDINTFYHNVEELYHISDRMIRRYIARGLMPPPERYGKRAYYDEAKSNVYSYLNIIDTLKKRYALSLDDIEVIINRYRDQIIELDLILADIEWKYNNPRRTSPYYVWIRKYFLERIQSKTENLEKLNIKAIEKEIKSKQP